MSQSTNLYTRIRFLDKTFNHRSEVEAALGEVHYRREYVLKELSMIAFMTEPSKFCGDESPEYYLKSKIEELSAELEECAVDDYKLTKLLDEWDNCHIAESGLGIAPPENITESIKWQSYIDGDFVLTNQHPTKESLLQ